MKSRYFDTADLVATSPPHVRSNPAAPGEGSTILLIGPLDAKTRWVVKPMECEQRPRSPRIIKWRTTLKKVPKLLDARRSIATNYKTHRFGANNQQPETM